MSRSLPVLALAGLVSLAAPASAQRLAFDETYTRTRTPYGGGVSISGFDADAKDRAVFGRAVGSVAQELSVRRDDVFGGADPTLPPVAIEAVYPNRLGYQTALDAVRGGSIAIGGSFLLAPPPATARTVFVGRVSESGEPDTSYGPQGFRTVALPFSATVETILVTGDRTYLALREVGSTFCAVAALRPGGELDPTFGTGGIARIDSPGGCTTNDLVETNAGDVIVLASAPSPAGDVSFVAALDYGGAPRTTFGTNGRRAITLAGTTLRLTTLRVWKGGVVAAGTFGQGVSTAGIAVAAVTHDGALDPGFSDDGIDIRSSTTRQIAGDVGLAVAYEYIVVTSAASGRIPPAGPPPEPSRDTNGLATLVYTPTGAFVPQDGGGSDGLGYLAIATYTAGGRPLPILSVDLAADSQGRVLLGFTQTFSGSGVQTTATDRLVLLQPTATDGAPEVAAALRVAPNPAAGAARVSLTLGTATDARVTVLDALGRTVAVLHDGPLAAGETTLALDAARLPAGVYAVVVQAGTLRQTARVTVVR